MRCAVGGLDLGWLVSCRVGIRCFSSRSKGLPEPLLPDYLRTVGDSLSSKVEMDGKDPVKDIKMPKAEAVTRSKSRITAALKEEAAAKEKMIVAAALQPSEPLSPLKTLLEPRPPVPSRLDPRVQSAELARILEQWEDERPVYQPEEIAVDTRENQELPAAMPSHSLEEMKIRLQVRPEHREKLREMMRKKVLADCLATLRVVQGQSQWDDPLWWFEARYAYKLVYTTSAQLIRFLTFKHLHIKHGLLRQSLIPGPTISQDQVTDLLEEWRQLTPWFQQSVGSVPEEVLLRKFLDGQLSWSVVLRALRVDPDRGPEERVR